RTARAQSPVSDTVTKGARDRLVLRTARCRTRLRQECLAQRPQHLGALALEHRHEPTQLQPHELDLTRRTHRPEAEVREEVARKHRAVHEEALVVRLALRIAVGEGLERRSALVLRLADRGKEERLQHPGARAVDQVGAGDQYRVVRGWAGGQLGRAWKEPRRSVLHRAEHSPVVVVVDGPPGAELRLGLLDPAPLVDPAATRARLPPDAVVTNGRHVLERGAGEPGEAGRHGAAISSTTTFTAPGR